MSAVGAAESRLLERAAAADTAAQLYELQQQGRTIVARYVARGQDQAAVALCQKLARALSQQPALAASFCTLLVGVLDEFELPGTPSTVGLLVSLAEELPYAGETTREFFIAAQNWARKVEAPAHLQRQLRSTAGRLLAAAGEFGLAQTAVLEVSDDCDVVAAVLRDWMGSSKLYPSERHLVPLRAVLLLLTRGSVDLALQIVESPVLGYNLDSEASPPPPPIQLAYLLAVACKTKNAAFFDHVKVRYGLVLFRDALLGSLVKQAEEKIFGRAPQNLLATLFGTAA